ncbi:Uncharacterised protein [Porphyromonas macacae]|uniref:Uncharacterized protein n=1 Tax=Porphyromonas macacae TaxID=28115 RepID=A0A379EBQ9_9PORP|nr:hypothetical protein [Porphyromonas macacae]SUB89870.1 Uncharacterised protein [Porphyromonas macacae]
MKKKPYPREEKVNSIPPAMKAGEYHTMFRTGLKWILPFVVSVLFCGMVGPYKYIAIFAVAGSVWGLALKHLSKRMVEIKFTDDSIIIDNTIFPMKEVENYYTCLPLRKAFMLRLQMKDGKRHIYYIPVECRNKVEGYMAKRAFLYKQKYDGFLCYSHYVFALIAVCFASICILLMSYYNLPFQLIK